MVSDGVREEGKMGADNARMQALKDAAATGFAGMCHL
jgi:hypothetical protein